ncbi:MAG: hypothetical protein GXO59_06355, partial [Dictyoglomi bacterium]|nr:hypothetical protein [Dictyoglomota bacterium]
LLMRYIKKMFGFVNGIAALVGWMFIGLLVVAFITGKEPVIYLADPAWDEEDWEKLLEEIEKEEEELPYEEEETEEESGEDISE